jgi:hypothetical protein
MSTDRGVAEGRGWQAGKQSKRGCNKPQFVAGEKKKRGVFPRDKEAL